MTTHFKKSVSLILSFVIALGIFSIVPINADAITQSEFDSKLNSLRSQYPDYSTWYDSFDGGTQCFGFARLIGYNVFGSYPSSWSKVYSIDNVKKGDLLQYGNTSGQGHTVFVTNVSGDTITFVDCNGSGNYSGSSKVRSCGIKWDNTINKYSNMFGKYSFSYLLSSPELTNSSTNPTDNYLDIGTDFYAYIEHQNTGMFLTNQNTNVAGETPTGATNQIWKFIRQSNGSYALQSYSNYYYMDVFALDEDNANVYTWKEYLNTSNQQFYIYYEYGAYSFRPAHSNTRRLDMSSTEDHNLSIWGQGEDWGPQKFNIIKIDINGNLPVDLGDEFYSYIEHKSSGLLLTNSNRNIFGAQANCCNNQIWFFKKQSNDAYSIQNLEDGYYMDVYGCYNEDNTNVYTWPEYTGGTNQQFYIYNLFGAYYFRPAHSNSRMLDMSSTEDHNLAIWGYGDDWSPQKFNINILTQSEIGKHKYLKNYIRNLDTNTISVKYICSICNDSYIDMQYFIGDSDFNGTVNINDVTFIQEYINETINFTDNQLYVADINNDNKIDILDATELQTKITYST